MRKHKSKEMKNIITTSNKASRIDTLVKVTTIVLCIFLAAYFILTLNNMSSISNYVERRKTGSYPVSVAAGHMETDLAVVTGTTRLVMSLENITVDPEKLRELFDRVQESMDRQIVLIKNPDVVREDLLAIMDDGYDEMVGRIDEFLSMLESSSYSDDELRDFVAENIYPLATELLETDNVIIESVSQDLESMYNYTNQAVRQTIILSLILISAVFITIVIYVNLLRRKQETEDKLMNDLSDALYMAENANAAKSSFLSNMSHDIRTPLNAIIGLTKIAEDNVSDPARMEQCLEQINTSSDHLLRLINDVLDMNKIESGKTTLIEETFSLGGLLSEIATIVESQVKEKNLDAEFVLRSIRHEYLIGDPMRIRQVLLNLISNAIKYTNEGDEMRVVVTELPSTDNSFANLRFVVSDTGLGMKEDFLQYIFEPFERERNDFTNFIEGTGLGMAITKNLVNMMGGDIKVESEFGVGSTFTVNLSLKVAEEMPSLDTDSFEGLKVLAIDDDLTSLRHTASVLNEFKIEAQEKYPGEFAPDSPTSELLNIEGGYDFVLVDLSISDEEAIDYVKTRVRTLFTNAGFEEMPPVIFVMHNWRKYEEEARQAGAIAFIEKPLFRSRLYDALKTATVDSERVRSEGEGKKKGTLEPLKGRVLIVEDNDINMEIAQVLVAKFGPEVEGAADGVEAVRKVKENPEDHYDLIFMDWQMPHMNGIEATKEILEFQKKENRRHIPIVAMTANAFNEDKRAVLEAGMDGFMSKPINIKELEKNLREFLK